MKVAIYIRESATRQYKLASPRAMYPSNVTFCLRYTLGGKRRWEQPSVGTYKEAQAESLRRWVISSPSVRVTVNGLLASHEWS